MRAKTYRTGNGLTRIGDRTTPWNYALDVHETMLSNATVFGESPVGDCPFSPEGARFSLKLRGRCIPQWQMENGSARAHRRFHAL
ncbi:MAG: hypothetical protein KAJ81_09520 [Candidatus Latescibacteria bacterium]|nr:hypothetical protein [Candidatus Latescibacterota bacterium]